MPRFFFFLGPSRSASAASLMFSAASWMLFCSFLSSRSALYGALPLVSRSKASRPASYASFRFSRTSSSSITRWIAGLDLICAATPAAPPAALAAFFLAAISSQLPLSFPPEWPEHTPDPTPGSSDIAGRRAPSHLIGGALHGDLHAVPEPAFGLDPRPFRIELVRDVGEDDALGVRELRVLARLTRCQVAARPLPLGPGERGLDEQQVGLAGELDERLGRRGVGREGEAATVVGGAHGDRVRAGEVRDLVERERERPNRRLVALAVLAQVEGVVDEVLRPPRAGDPPEHVPRAGRRDEPRAGRLVGARPHVHGHRLLARGVRERIGVGDDVEDVVGVEMREDDRVDLRVIPEAPELPEDAVAHVEHHVGVALGEEIPTARTVDVLPR